MPNKILYCFLKEVEWRRNNINNSKIIKIKDIIDNYNYVKSTSETLYNVDELMEI